MRVVYDAATGRVAALGDAVAADEALGQAQAEVTPDETAALATATGAAREMEEQLRAALATVAAARAGYEAAATAVRERFAAAERAATAAGGVVGYDPARGFATIAVAPVPEPTPEEDAALVASDPRLAALLRVLARAK